MAQKVVFNALSGKFDIIDVETVATAAEVITGTNNSKMMTPQSYQDAWGQKNKMAQIAAMRFLTGY